MLNYQDSRLSKNYREFFVDATDPPMDAGYFKKRPNFFQNDHCTARGSQHFD